MKYLHITLLACCAALNAGPVSAVDFGPLTLRGFVLATYSYATHQCPRCQLHHEENRQRSWADDLDANKQFKSTTTLFTLVQPYLALRPQRLGRGFSVAALLSQRWRDGKVDIEGIWYERNITLAHEYHGSLQYGAFPTRGWGVADYPYGSFVGLADAWGSSGAGYGLLTNAIRLTSPPLAVFKGDVRLEVTYDPGDSRYKQNQKFWEYYLQFVRGRLVIDLIHQDAKNGKPDSWTHGPFLGLTDNPKYDKVYQSGAPLPQNNQRIWLLMARYGFFNKYEVMAGYRRNFWSGNSAVAVGINDEGDLLWNNMFNVDWDGTLNGESNPGYPARSQDLLLGGRYFYTPSIIIAAGMVRLNKAETRNPRERGQSNAATLGNLGISYIGLYPGLMLSIGISGVQYDKKGLAPLSMPSHSAFSGVDSRVKQSGVAAGITATWNF